jgi:flagellar basal-body rod protein FlgG
MNSRLNDLANSGNSLSNSNTTGYKSSRMNFQELLTEADRSGVKLSSSQLLMTQGKLRQTENPTDVAINGNGFFSVSLPNGDTGYTRDGSFILDENNQLLNTNGYKIIFQGTIPADANEITIDQVGTISARVNDNMV